MRAIALATLTGLGLAALLVMVIMTLLTIATRFLSIAGLEWSYEVAGIAFVWTTFLGAALAETRYENVAFEVIRNNLPEYFQAGFDRLSAMLLLAVGATIAASGVAALLRTGWVPTPLLRWPGGLQTAAAPVLGLSLCSIALQRLLTRRASSATDLGTSMSQGQTETPL